MELEISVELQTENYDEATNDREQYVHPSGGEYIALAYTSQNCFHTHSF